jgi:hypothetical protein
MAMLVVLLALGGVVSAQVQQCPDCYSNIVTQLDVQTIDTVRFAMPDVNGPIVKTAAVGNEGLTAGIIVTSAPENPSTQNQLFVSAPFATINQAMTQTVSNLGDPVMLGDGVKGITWNKAIQAAWAANQGVKELERNDLGVPVYVKEGTLIIQDTSQLILNIYDYDSREKAKVLNVDNKLAMAVDDLEAVIDLTANADSTTTDTQSSTGAISNDVNITIAGYDP